MKCKWKHVWAASMAAALCTAYPVLAQSDGFHSGKVITGFGPVASVEQDVEIPADTRFKVLFDVSKAAKPGEINRTLVSAARFINMHAEAGVDPGNIEIAVVFHGGASIDLTRPEIYSADNNGAENANAGAIETLRAHNVKIYLCGQSAAYHGIANKDLLPGVDMALSAMTMHALLQQEGYTLNPF